MLVSKHLGTGVRIPPPPSAFAKASADVVRRSLKAVPAIAFSEGGLLYCFFHGRKVRAVYFIRSIGHPQQTYIGVTSDLNQRLKDHNAGKSVHTNK